MTQFTYAQLQAIERLVTERIGCIELQAEASTGEAEHCFKLCDPETDQGKRAYEALNVEKNYLRSKAKQRRKWATLQKVVRDAKAKASRPRKPLLDPLLTEE
jgi:hypothetical protein